MRELNLDHLPTDMRGLHPNSRNGKGTPKGQPKSESCRVAMRKAYKKRRESGWRQTHSAETRAKLSASNKGNTNSVKYLYHTPDGVMRMKDAVEYYGKGPTTIGGRAKSDNPKFKNWYRIEKG